MTTFDFDPDETLRIITALDYETSRLEDLNSLAGFALADQCIALSTRIRVESRRALLGQPSLDAIRREVDETPKGPQGAAQRYADGLNAFEAQRPAESWHLAEGKTNGANIVYTVDKPGARFTRIVATWTDGSNRHVHAFVENATGHVYKPAGWKAPAKIVRFTSVEAALEKAAEHPLQAFTGGYLYIR